VLLSGFVLLLATAVVRADDWGTVKGRIVWGGGPLPEPRELSVEKDAEHCLSKGKLFSENWIIHKQTQGVRWVFVWLIPDPAGTAKKLPVHPMLARVNADPVVIDQPCCQFVPHAVALREGEVLVARNSSPIPHNINWTGPPENPGNNVIIPAGASLALAPRLVAGRNPVTVNCNVHPWMKAWVRVFDHPYFAVTDADGKFEIKLAPAGKCHLVIWHEEAGWGPGLRQGQPIAIPANGVMEVPPVPIKPAP
jgi:hypothetical protein